MTRRAMLCFAAGVVALGAADVIGASRADVVRAAFAAWLVLIALPLGALPVLMALDLADRVTSPGTRALRFLVSGFPLAAIMGLALVIVALVAPARIDLAPLYPWSTGTTNGFAPHWFSPLAFGLRAILYLVVWLVLSVVFMGEVDQPSAIRRKLAALGLALHLVVGTLAALDWTLSLDLGPNASAFGLLSITLQIAFAVTAALLITLAAPASSTPPRGLIVMLLVAVSAAVFMQFTQYLVVWSANLPREIAWYQHRSAGFGAAFIAAASVIVLLAFVTMMPVGLSARKSLVAPVIVLLLMVEATNILWLVTPSWRHAFVVPVIDVLALVGFGGVLGAAALLIDDRAYGRARHG